MAMPYEKNVITYLKGYKRMKARIQVLAKYPLGNGLRLAELLEDRELLELVRQARRVRLRDEADERQRLEDLQQDIAARMAARAVTPEQAELAVQRLYELHQLEAQRAYMDQALDALASYGEKYSRLLRLLFVEDKSSQDAAAELQVSKTVFYEWRQQALEEFAYMIGEKH